MQHISEIIEEILVEWAYRVHDGMPNPKNTLHIVELRESMKKLNIPSKVIYEVIENLINEEDNTVPDKVKKKAKQLGLIWKRVGYGKEGEEGITHKVEDGKLVPVEDKKDKEKDKQTDTPTPKVTQIDATPFKSTDDKKDKEDQGTEEQRTYLRQTDHETTDKQLLFTKSEARAQAKKKGEKGVGLGTPASRAGEAAVHYTLRQILPPNNKSIDEVKQELLKIANDKDKVLDKNWVNAAVNTAEWLQDVYSDDIKDVVWDTPEGRELIGAQGHGTSADMFLKLKNGKNIGVSLKQTTAVFLLNGGYAKQHEKLIGSLRESLSSEELEEFEKTTSVQNYDLNIRQHLTSFGNEFSNNENFKNLLKERLEVYKNLSEEEFIKTFGSDKYLKYLDKTEEIFKKLPDVREEEKKWIGKITKDVEIRKQFSQFYENMRNEEVLLTQSILQASTSNPNASKALKKICLDGMHAEDILFGKSKQLDEFITLYGNKPAVELSKGVLLKIFGLQEKYEQYLSIDDDDEKEEFKQQLLDEMNDKLIIDVKDGAKAGEIKIVHNEYGEFHLFGVKARAKGILASPALEMYQTSFMGNVIKEGTTDINEWDRVTRVKFVRTRITEIKEEMEDASKEQRKALQVEIDKLESII